MAVVEAVFPANCLEDYERLPVSVSGKVRAGQTAPPRLASVRTRLGGHALKRAIRGRGGTGARKSVKNWPVLSAASTTGGWEELALFAGPQISIVTGQSRVIHDH